MQTYKIVKLYITMQTITISREEYNTLLESKLKFDYLQQILKDDLFSSPPTKNTDAIIAAFNQTGKYNKAFINSLKKGLKRSSYFNNK